MTKKKGFWGVFERAFKKLGWLKFYFFVIGIGIFSAGLSKTLFSQRDFFSLSLCIIFFVIFYFIILNKLFKTFLGEK